MQRQPRCWIAAARDNRTEAPPPHGRLPTLCRPGRWADREGSREPQNLVDEETGEGRYKAIFMVQRAQRAFSSLDLVQHVPLHLCCQDSDCSVGLHCRVEVCSTQLVCPTLAVPTLLLALQGLVFLLHVLLHMPGRKRRARSTAAKGATRATAAARWAPDTTAAAAAAGEAGGASLHLRHHAMRRRREFGRCSAASSVH